LSDLASVRPLGLSFRFAMMCRGSKGVIFGGVLACAVAVRSKVNMEGASAVQAVDTMAALLSLKHEEVRRIAEAVDGQATPGASDHYTTALKAVLDKIEGELKPKVFDLQQEAQTKVDETLTAVQEAERSAASAKGSADKQDQALFACVSAELQKKEFHETAQEKLVEAQKDEKDASAEKDKSRQFSHTAGDKYQMSMQCDNGIAGGCAGKKKALMTSMQTMIQDTKNALAAKMKYFKDMETQHKSRQTETANAQTAMDAAAENHESHRNKCEAAKTRRDRAVCEYGDMLQAKGVEENEFMAVIEDINGEGGENSESDRMKEWNTLSHMECMLKKGIAKGLKGPIDTNDHGACADQPDLTLLARKAGEFEQLSKSHANVARPITFSSGQEWIVSSNGEAAADYSKQAFSVTLNPDEGEQPFDMCPDENDGWKNLVAEKLTAASAVPNQFTALAKAWWKGS